MLSAYHKKLLRQVRKLSNEASSELNDVKKAKKEKRLSLFHEKYPNVKRLLQLLDAGYTG